MTNETFSERYGLRPPSQAQALMYNKVSDVVRERLYQILEQLREKHTSPMAGTILFPSYVQFWDACRRRVRRPIETVIGHGEDDEAQSELVYLLMGCPFFEFYDAVEAMSECISNKYYKEHGETEFTEEVNILFEANQIGYRLKDGKVERIGAQFPEEVKERARKLLEDPRFEGPNEQFEGAIRHLSHRPEPECDDCAHDAVNALEGVARILTGKPTTILSQLLKTNPLRDMIPEPLNTVFEKLYAYRGSEPGVGHAQVGPLRVGVAEAELVLGLCANMIVYLVAKFNSTGQA